MSVKNAQSFLQKLEQDKELRAKVAEVAELENMIRASLAKQEKLKAQINQETGLKFTEEELFQALGIPKLKLSKETKEQLKALDAELRKRGLEGINPLAYEAYAIAFVC